MHGDEDTGAGGAFCWETCEKIPNKEASWDKRDGRKDRDKQANKQAGRLAAG